MLSPTLYRRSSQIFAGIYDVLSTQNLKRHSKENPNCFYHAKEVKTGKEARGKGKFLHFALKMPGIKQHVFSCFMTYRMYADPVSGRKKCVIVAIPKLKYEFNEDLAADSVSTLVMRKEKVKDHGYLPGDMSYVYVLEAYAPRLTHLSQVVDVNFDSSCPKGAVKKKLDELLNSVDSFQMRYERNRNAVDNEVLAHLKEVYEDPSTEAKLLKHSKEQTKLVDRGESRERRV